MDDGFDERLDCIVRRYEILFTASQEISDSTAEYAAGQLGEDLELVWEALNDQDPKNPLYQKIETLLGKEVFGSLIETFDLLLTASHRCVDDAIHTIEAPWCDHSELWDNLADYVTARRFDNVTVGFADWLTERDPELGSWMSNRRAKAPKPRVGRLGLRLLRGGRSSAWRRKPTKP